MSKNSWIAIDLDRTLAIYDGWVSETHIGDPIVPMLNRVKKWVEEGRDVRIFTARVSRNNKPHNDGATRNYEDISEAIEQWCLKHVGKILPITCEKDNDMAFLYDDRAVQVEPNTGKILGLEPELKPVNTEKGNAAI